MKLNKDKKLVPKRADTVIRSKRKPNLQLFFIVCKANVEHGIAELLRGLGAGTMTTTSARGSSRTPTAAFDIVPEEEICIIGIIGRHQAANMIKSLEEQFDFTDPHSGIAWTVNIEEDKIK